MGPATPWPRQGFAGLPNEHRGAGGVRANPTSGSESPGPRVATVGASCDRPRSPRFSKLQIPALRFGLVGLLQKSAPGVGPATPWPRQGFAGLPNEHRSVSGVGANPTSGSESPGPRVATDGASCDRLRSPRFSKLQIPALRFGLVGLLQKSAPCVGPAARTKKGRLPTKPSFSTPGRVRTSNLRFRRPMLYPVELRVLVRREADRAEIRREIVSALSRESTIVADRRRLARRRFGRLAARSSSSVQERQGGLQVRFGDSKSPAFSAASLPPTPLERRHTSNLSERHLLPLPSRHLAGRHERPTGRRPRKESGRAEARPSPCRPGVIVPTETSGSPPRSAASTLIRRLTRDQREYSRPTKAPCSSRLPSLLISATPGRYEKLLGIWFGARAMPVAPSRRYPPTARQQGENW